MRLVIPLCGFVLSPIGLLSEVFVVRVHSGALHGATFTVYGYTRHTLTLVTTPPLHQIQTPELDTRG